MNQIRVDITGGLFDGGTAVLHPRPCAHCGEANFEVENIFVGPDVGPQPTVMPDMLAGYDLDVNRRRLVWRPVCRR